MVGSYAVIKHKEFYLNKFLFVGVSVLAKYFEGKHQVLLT